MFSNRSGGHGMRRIKDRASKACTLAHHMSNSNRTSLATLVVLTPSWLALQPPACTKENARPSVSTEGPSQATIW